MSYVDADIRNSIPYITEEIIGFEKKTVTETKVKELIDKMCSSDQLKNINKDIIVKLCELENGIHNKKLEEIGKKLSELKNSAIHLPNKSVLKINLVSEQSRQFRSSTFSESQKILKNLLIPQNVNELIQEDSFFMQKKRSSLLWQACYHNDLEMVNILLKERGANPNIINEDKTTEQTTTIAQFATYVLKGIIDLNKDSLEILKQLHTFKAKLEPTDPSFQSSLFGSLQQPDPKDHFKRFISILDTLMGLDQNKASGFVNLRMTPRIDEININFYEEKLSKFSLLEYAFKKADEVRDNKELQKDYIQVIEFLIKNQAESKEIQEKIQEKMQQTKAVLGETQKKQLAILRKKEAELKSASTLTQKLKEKILKITSSKNNKLKDVKTQLESEVAEKTTNEALENEKQKFVKQLEELEQTMLILKPNAFTASQKN